MVLRASRWAKVATVLTCLCAACSLVSPSDDAEPKQSDCPTGEKRCDGKCVPTDDPTWGCGSSACQPCALDGADAVCIAGQCRVGTCQPGRADCDGAPANGCEAKPATDPEHCGGCGKSCVLPGSETACTAGHCTLGGCKPGYADCNGAADDGCETNLSTSAASCGACGAACQIPQAYPACVGAACQVGACYTGRGDCDGKVLNGCETDLATELAHCGACNQACAPSHASGKCSVGACEIASCQGAWADCNGKPADGCETDLKNDAAHCGGCGKAVKSGEVCKSGVPTQNDAALIAWLDKQNGGWCNDQFSKFLNLCGTVSACPWEPGKVYPTGMLFCCDPKLMRSYADGMAFDLGFHWDGVSSGTLMDAGGDCDGKRASCTLEKNVLSCVGPGAAPQIKAPLPAAGRFLLSYRVTASWSELWVNGVRVGGGTGSGTVPVLTPTCGPGFNLGQRISYWWESSPGQWLRFAPFFFHFRDQAPAQNTWSLADSITKQAHSVMLFEPGTANGDAWPDAVEARTGLLCGGKDEAAKEGFPIPCPGKKWVADASGACL